MKNLAKTTTLVTVLALLAGTAYGELTKQDNKTIKQELKSHGTLYPRMDLPCTTGRHPYGIYVSPLIEVGPEGVRKDDAENNIGASWWHAESTYWGVTINTPVTFDEVEIEAEEKSMEIEVLTLDEDTSTVVKLIGINSLDDFRAAFAHAFSAAPLQSEHDDWSDEVKNAIAERRLMAGMTKRQVFYVTGAPESFEKKDENGVEVETWTLRQSKGVQTGFWFSRVGEKTGLPGSLRFEDGKLIQESGGTEKLSLD